MSAFTHLPLGQRIPPSLHGVSCSLPTMRAVVGYEEKHPEIVAQMTSGYPRFVQHPLLKKASAHVLKEEGLTGHSLWLTSSIKAAEALHKWLRVSEAKIINRGTLTGVAFPENTETFLRAKTFLQHTGMLLSSREAEDYLVRVGEIPAAEPESDFEGYAAARVKGALTRAYRNVGPEDIFLANSGMNAVYAAFRVAEALQSPRGRKVWVQLGWLYLDTIAILQKFTDSPERDYVLVSNPLNFAELEKLFAERGSEIAGVITEVPTNPLIQTADMPALHELCRRHGALLIADPTIASPLNIDILPHCDISVASLTKYAANEGDVLMGSVAVNPKSEYADAMRAQMAAALEPVYSRDVARMAAQIGGFEPLIQQINRSAPKVIEFLRGHPKVKELYWSLEPASRENYLRIARSPECVGSMISFVVEGPLERFYDRLRLPKGPSFGMKTTLICPFIYLAHYDLVTSPAGQEILRRNGLHPELLRLSIGAEPAQDIVDALAEALG